MTHLATADSGCSRSRAQRRSSASGQRREQYSHLTRHCGEQRRERCDCRSPTSTPRAAVSRSTACPPFNTDPQEDGLEPVLSWQYDASHRSSGSSRDRAPATDGASSRRSSDLDRDRARSATADGFRRDLTGTGDPRGGRDQAPGRRDRVDGFASRSSSTCELPVGAPVVLHRARRARRGARRVSPDDDQLRAIACGIRDGPLGRGERSIDA